MGDISSATLHGVGIVIGRTVYTHKHTFVLVHIHTYIFALAHLVMGNIWILIEKMKEHKVKSCSPY